MSNFPNPGALPPPPSRKGLLVALGIGAGCLVVLLLLAVVGGVGWYLYQARPKYTYQPAPAEPEPRPEPASPAPSPAVPETAPPPPAYTPPPAPSAPAPAPLDVQLYVNTKDHLPAALSAHQINFIFAYPSGWKLDTSLRTSGQAFISVQRNNEKGLPVEQFSVAYWPHDPRLKDADMTKGMADLVAKALQASVPNFRKLSLGAGHASNYPGLELSYTGRGERTINGRTVMLNRQAADQKDAPMLSMIATDLSEAKTAGQVGLLGQLPLILNTFRWGSDFVGAANAFKTVGNSGPKVVFLLLDGNADGYLTGAELLNNELLRFDRDGDGRVSMEEYVAANPNQ